MEDKNSTKKRTKTDDEIIAEIDEQVKALLAKKKQVTARVETKSRDRDNKQKFLMGAAADEEAERDPEFQAMFRSILHRFLTREYDRSFFSRDTDPFILPPREKPNAPATVQPENEPA